MDAALETILKAEPEYLDGMAFASVPGDDERVVYHREELVRLGVMFHKVYRFEAALDPEAAHRPIWLEVMKRFPDNYHVTLSWPGNELEVWDYVARREEWDMLAQQLNRPEFYDSVGSN